MKSNQSLLIGLLAIAAYLYMMKARADQEAMAKQNYVYRSEGVYL